MIPKLRTKNNFTNEQSASRRLLRPTVRFASFWSVLVSFHLIWRLTDSLYRTQNRSLTYNPNLVRFSFWRVSRIFQTNEISSWETPQFDTKTFTTLILYNESTRFIEFETKTWLTLPIKSVSVSERLPLSKFPNEISSKRNSLTYSGLHLRRTFGSSMTVTRSPGHISDITDK